jgi:hypothetical protein
MQRSEPATAVRHPRHIYLSHRRYQTPCRIGPYVRALLSVFANNRFDRHSLTSQIHVGLKKCSHDASALFHGVSLHFIVIGMY